MGRNPLFFQLTHRAPNRAPALEAMLHAYPARGSADRSVAAQEWYRDSGKIRGHGGLSSTGFRLSARRPRPGAVALLVIGVAVGHARQQPDAGSFSM